jgi:hypothetical protein
MPPREQLQTNVGLRDVGRKDSTAAQKALKLVQPQKTNVTERYERLTARVLPAQIRWVREQAYAYTTNHPHRPRLTQDELIRLAIEHLRKTKNLDQLVDQYRQE